MFRVFTALAVSVLAFAATAAPELSDADRQRLADETTDHDAVLDDQGGLYVLLRNAAGWQGDDFAGDRGAAVAPPPDYEFLKDKPAEARGNVYLIEGWVMKHERWPTKDNDSRDRLHNTLDPAWGEQVTRWIVVTERGNPKATVLVLFTDPSAKMADPGEGTKVRIAARFFKQWSTTDANGKPFTYAVFVGGAAEEIEDAASGATSPTTIVLVGIVTIMGAFFVVRYLLNRSGGGTRTRERLDEIRREREAYEEEGGGDEGDEDLPEDPVAALDVLHDRHGSD